MLLPLHLDPEMKAQLQPPADADRRSLINYVELILVGHLAKHGT